jgi:hypothetical protein
MQPYELIRRAAEIIRTGGWATGQDETGNAIAALDASGEPVRLLDASTGGESRVRVNRKAVAFSAYGALVKAQELHGEPPSVGLMWDTLYRLARELGATPEGGVNFVHPIIQYNAAEGRTKEEVLAFAIEAKAGGGRSIMTDAMGDAIPRSVSLFITIVAVVVVGFKS